MRPSVACDFVLDDRSVCKRTSFSTFVEIGGATYCGQHAEVVLYRLTEGLRTAPDGYPWDQLRAAARAYDHQQKAARSVVYFVERAGFIKIGFSTDYRRRITQVARGGTNLPPGVEPGPVRLLATEPAPDTTREGALHTRFARSRIQGTEWFRPSERLRSYIQELPGCVAVPSRLVRPGRH